MPPLRQREGVDGLGQVGEHGLERAPGIGDAVQEHHGDARWISLLDILELDSVGKRDGFDGGCRTWFHRFFLCSAGAESPSPAASGPRWQAWTKEPGQTASA